MATQLGVSSPQRALWGLPVWEERPLFFRGQHRALYEVIGSILVGLSAPVVGRSLETKPAPLSCCRILSTLSVRSSFFLKWYARLAACRNGVAIIGVEAFEWRRTPLSRLRGEARSRHHGCDTARPSTSTKQALVSHRSRVGVIASASVQAVAVPEGHSASSRRYHL